MSYYEYNDANLHLPSYFITCFDHEALPRYEEAIRRYALIDPEHRLDIDQTGTWNCLHQPALLWYRETGHRDLSEFWKIMRMIEAGYEAR